MVKWSSIRAPKNLFQTSASIKENLNKIDIKHVIKQLETLVNIPCHLIQNDEPENSEIK